MEETHTDMPMELRNSLPHSQAMDSLLTVLDVLDAYVLIVDQESRIRFFNLSYLDAYQSPLARVGIPQEKILGLPLVSLPDSRKDWELFQRIMKSGKALQKYYFQDEDGRGGVTATSPNYPITGYVIKKFVNPMDALQGTGARQIQKAYPIIRYAEILLSYAEALNNLTTEYTVELGGQQYTVSRDKEAIRNAFNLVRYRAGLPGLRDSQLEDPEEVQAQIERERMVEFLYENRRYYDVRRWGIYEETENEPIRGMNPDGATKETYYQRVNPSSSSFLTRVVNKRSVWVPIPRDEMRRLPSLDQNPGY